MVTFLGCDPTARDPRMERRTERESNTNLSKEPSLFRRMGRIYFVWYVRAAKHVPFEEREEEKTFVENIPHIKIHLFYSMV